MSPVGIALLKMRDAGFDVHAVAGRVRVSPSDRLTADQRTYIRDHKVMLVEELQAEAANDAALVVVMESPQPPAVPRSHPASDAMTRRIVEALQGAGGYGMKLEDLARLVDWYGRTTLPMVAAEVDRLRLAGKVGEVNGRLVLVDPPMVVVVDAVPPPMVVVDPSPAAAAVLDPRAERIAELIADDWAPWCARARAESEALPDWKGSRGRATAEPVKTQPATGASMSPLARRILETLQGAGGRGMLQEDLAKLVDYGKSGAPMVALEVGNLRLAGLVGKVNGRLVLEAKA
jgi:hypothetical protein